MTVEATALDLNNSTWPPVGNLHTYSSHPLINPKQTASMLHIQHQWHYTLVHISLFTDRFSETMCSNSEVRTNLPLDLHLLSKHFQQEGLGPHSNISSFLMLKAVWVSTSEVEVNMLLLNDQDSRNFLNITNFFAVVLNCNILSWILNASKKLLVEAPTSSHLLKA